MASDSKAVGLVGARAAKFSSEIEAGLLNRAEKELAAFVRAVDTLYGEEQACAAAADWLLELIALKHNCKGASPDLNLRSVTIGAARRLARAPVKVVPNFGPIHSYEKGACLAPRFQELKANCKGALR